MNDALLSFAIRIQSIAQAGLQYGRDPYDLERYAQLRQIAAEMLSLKTELSTEHSKTAHSAPFRLAVCCFASLCCRLAPEGFLFPQFRERQTAFQCHLLPGDWVHKF